MSPLEAAVVVALATLPFHLLLQRESAKLCDPAYLRRRGVVIARLSAIDDHAPSIGCYMGQEIWASVTFKGMLYRYDRIVPRSYRHRVGARELFIDPGLVYVTD